MKLFLTSKFHFVAHNIAGKLSTEQKQSVVFITTGFKYRNHKEGELDWHYKNLTAMDTEGYKYDLYDIIGKSSNDIESDLAKYQTMYVEGGSAFFLMQESLKNNFGDYIKNRVKAGMVYISESAGSCVMGPDFSANSRPGKSITDFDLSSSAGFGIVNFNILPHWGQKEKVKDYLTYKIPQSYNEDFPYILLSNNQYVEVTDDWYKIVDVTS